MTYLELAQRARADLARDPACAQGTTIAADPSGSQGTTIAADPPDGRAANLASQQESHSVIHPASPVSLPTDPARLFTHLSALLLIIQCGCRNGHHHNLPVASPAIIDALEAAIHPAADDAEIPRLLDQLRPDGPGPTLAAVIAMYRRRLTLLTSLGEDTFFAEAELTLSLHYQPRKDNL